MCWILLRNVQNMRVIVKLYSMAEMFFQQLVFFLLFWRSRETVVFPTTRLWIRDAKKNPKAQKRIVGGCVRMVENSFALQSHRSAHDAASDLVDQLSATDVFSDSKNVFARFKICFCCLRSFVQSDFLSSSITIQFCYSKYTACIFVNKYFTNINC